MLAARSNSISCSQMAQISASNGSGRPGARKAGLDRTARPFGILPELFRRKSIHEPVEVAVTTDFVAAFGNLPNEVWITFRDPAEDEKSGSYAALAQEFQNVFDLKRYA